MVRRSRPGEIVLGKIHRQTPLPQSFYAEGAIVVAQRLLGQYLISRTEGVITGGAIVETEAYCGVLDAGCHAFGFRRTTRTQAMYGQPGSIYVYLIYGLHYCFNVVALRPEAPHAVLIRAIRPEFNRDVMIRRRQRSTESANHSLTDGPGKLTQALAIDQRHNEGSLRSGPIQIFPGSHPSSFEALPRVGLGRAGVFRDVPWRFRLE